VGVVSNILTPPGPGESHRPPSSLPDCPPQSATTRDPLRRPVRSRPVLDRPTDPRILANCTPVARPPGANLAFLQDCGRESGTG